MTVETIPDFVGGIFGGRGTGKSTRMLEIISQRKEKRMLVMDPKREVRYTRLGTVTSSLDAVIDIATLKEGGWRKSFSIIYRPPSLDSSIYDGFSVLCDIAMAAGDLLLVVDEGSLVTKPNWSPTGWRNVVNIGRDPAHVRVLLGSQRPAHVDKDFFGNCTMLCGFRQNYDDDVMTMARVLRQKKDDIGSLPNYEYFERDASNGSVTRGKTRKRR